MSATTNHQGQPRAVFTARSALRQFMTLLVFNTLIAIGVSAFSEHSLLINLLFSQLIGLCIWGCLQLQMLIFIPQPLTQWKRMLIAVPIAVVGGYLSGQALSMRILFGPDFNVAPTGAQNTLGYLLLSLAVGAATTYYFMSRERLAQEIRRADVASHQATEARLRLLESQLEPHMLFNTLSNLRVLMGIDAVRAQTMLDHMTDYLRATLRASQASTHPLATEYARLNDYLELIALRMGPRLQFELNLPEELATIPVPALLLQPLVENSIRHGLEPTVAGGHVRVSACKDGSQLHINVHDNGVGFNPADNEQGYGLQHIRERLQTLYGNHAGLSFELPAGGGTLAHITLPISA